jgi:hypothetical protein
MRFVAQMLSSHPYSVGYDSLGNQWDLSEVGHEELCTDHAIGLWDAQSTVIHSLFHAKVCTFSFYSASLRQDVADTSR